MYHYVRNNENYSYDTYSRRKDEFEAQIEYFIKKAPIINPGDKDMLNYYINNKNRYSFLLTFDDGYKDHYYCSEYLNSKDISGLFFPPINAIKGSLLDVNKIHLLIGKRKSVCNILEEIRTYCIENSVIISLYNKDVDINQYIKNIDIPITYDNPNTYIIKKLLQKDIKCQEIRTDLCNLLLKALYTSKHKKIAKELYLNEIEMKEMKSKGMFFGSHGVNHKWLSKLQRQFQEVEIRESFSKLEEIGLIEKGEDKVMCYPFGDYNDITIDIMKKEKIEWGFSSKSGAALLSSQKNDDNYKIKRWDTNSYWDEEWRRPTSPT